MEGIACAQHHGHQAEQAELGILLAAADHADAHGKDGDKIKNVENGFNDCSHKILLLYGSFALLLYGDPVGGCRPDCIVV